MLTSLVNGTLRSTTNPIAALATLSTEGGETVQINGTNFGPALPRSYVTDVWYGSGSGTQFSLTNCTFTVDETQIQCLTVPGVGTGYAMQVQTGIG